MAFSSPSPPSSSAEPLSPCLTASDPTLDPADPLNFLLNNPSPMDESGAAEFNQTSSMWPETDFSAQMKPYGAIDFNDLSSLPMDIDYMNAIAVDPSALQYNNNFSPHYAFDAHIPSYMDEFSSTQFPFTFQVHHDPSSPSDSSSMQSSSSSSGRRLSISSSVSSSGASLSPAPESLPSPVAANLVPNQPPATEQPTSTTSTSSDAATLLAERVRQSAGVMLALPMTAQLQAFESPQQTENTAPNTSTAMPKLPIPRLPRHASQSIANSTTTSAASTPPPTTPSPPPAIAATPSSPSGPQPRSKTSHTTIERRYRTNLNARIQSLRMAVPALRVVDDRDGSKKRAPNKVLVSADPLRSYTMGEDVVDERGFVDGVKVARKCSKANVLGKAVEYIRVLKKREARLKNEQVGLKSLISGLVGGPALLREWEREWKEMFGGEEKDEVEGEIEPEADDEDSEEEGDEEEEGGRKRKRGKVSPSSSSAPQVKVEKKEKKVALGPDGTVAEKRKRGRPRKVVPPPVPPPPTVSTEQEQEQVPVQQPQGAQQYLLATFALFSFFNSPITSFSSSSGSSSPSHVHTGTVLNGSTIPLTAENAGGWGVSYCLQLFHLLVSVVVLVSCVSSWAGIKLGPVVFGKSRSKSSAVFGALKTVRKDRENRTPEDWVRLGESFVLSSQRQPPIPLLSRIQVYYHITSRANAGVSDICTAALALYDCSTPLGSLARAKARSVWSKRTGSTSTLYERLVLEEMSVDEAAARLPAAATMHPEGQVDEDGDEPRTPMHVLATSLVRERVRKHLGVLFVGCVRVEDADVEGVEGEEREKELIERNRTIEAAKELGGSVGELGRRLERLWKVPTGEFTLSEVKEDEDEDEMEVKVETLVDAVVLYRRVFSAGAAGGVGCGQGNANPASALMSPPPSPGRKGRDADADVGRLRRALGSRVFEESGALEDARDRAVDRVVELERRNVGLS
ncbi:hypothetical protein C0995_009975 [Termitomyces sp. Mi166|nr:hypothetical protein C0995_009975 [Termitomyces sp. Mi166\